MSNITATEWRKPSLTPLVISGLVVAVTFLLGGIYLVGLILAIISGALAAIFQVAYWRTKRDWLHAMPLLAIGLTAISADGGFLWGYPQTFAFGYIFYRLIMFLICKFIPALRSQHDS